MATLLEEMQNDLVQLVPRWVPARVKIREGLLEYLEEPPVVMFAHKGALFAVGADAAQLCVATDTDLVELSFALNPEATLMLPVVMYATHHVLLNDVKKAIEPYGRAVAVMSEDGSVVCESPS